MKKEMKKQGLGKIDRRTLMHPKTFLEKRLAFDEEEGLGQGGQQGEQEDSAEVLAERFAEGFLEYQARASRGLWCGRVGSSPSPPPVSLTHSRLPTPPHPHHTPIGQGQAHQQGGGRGAPPADGHALAAAPYPPAGWRGRRGAAAYPQERERRGPPRRPGALAGRCLSGWCLLAAAAGRPPPLHSSSHMVFARCCCCLLGANLRPHSSSHPP